MMFEVIADPGLTTQLRHHPSCFQSYKTKWADENERLQKECVQRAFLPGNPAMLAPDDRVVLYRLDLTWHFAGRANVTLLHAAQRVCQCRYGAALFSIVSASRFDGDGQETPRLACRRASRCRLCSGLVPAWPARLWYLHSHEGVHDSMSCESTSSAMTITSKSTWF
jgi:hypothetical protein